MSEKPSYLDLLCGISRVESCAHGAFTAWAEITPSPDVRRVLLTVAAREGEHGMAFAKRVNELGYEVEPKHDPKAEELVAIATSDCSDVEKFEALDLGNLDTGILTFFDTVFKDHTIDIRTGELMGRYIAEEHDTARLFKACYEQLTAGRAGSSSSSALEAKVDQLCAAVEQLQEAVSELAGPSVNGKNGKAKAKVATA